MNPGYRSVPALAALLAAMAWRFLPVWAAVLASIAAILVSLAIGLLGRREPPGRRLAPLALATAVIASLGLLPTAVWPCGLACSGAAAYQQIWGLPVLGPAVALYLIVAWQAWSDRYREHLLIATRLLAWIAIGVSCYFVWLSIRLGMVCPHCLAVHGAVFCWLGVLLGQTRGWSGRFSTAALAALTVHALYHPGPIGASSSGGTTVATGDFDDRAIDLLLAADRGRRFGLSDAPWRAELVVDPQCQHCAEVIPALINGLQPAISAGRLELVLRLRHGHGEVGGERLVRLAHAAAAAGRLRNFVFAVLGTATGLDAEALGLRLPPDSADLLALERRYEHVLDRARLLDLARIEALGLRGARTPSMALFARGQARPAQEWRSEVPLAEVLRVLNRP